MAQSPEDLDISGLSIENNEAQQETLVAVDEVCAADPMRRKPELSRPDKLVRQYLRDCVPEFCNLDDLRTEGWNSLEADEHFKKLQQNADNADDDTKEKFYEMNKQLGEELHAKTDAFYVRKKWGAGVTSLNLCIAPGGYTWYFLKKNPTARSFGITLSTEDGGHPMYLPYGEDDERVEVEYLDITMLASEFGTPIEDVPTQHPEASKFSAHRPFLGKVFDVVICDGQVLRVHQHQRSRTREVVRLLVSQLILGLQRIKPGGTFIILLHKVDVWDNLILLQTFEAFSKIQVYKSEKVHAGRSSFYLVAKDVQPSSTEAVKAVENWKMVWWRATFAGEGGTGLDRDEPKDEDIEDALKAYGPRLIQLGQPIWSIQLKAMRRASFMRNERDRRNSAGYSKAMPGKGTSFNR